MEIILLAKALHVVGFVSWFSGLFYLGRVLVHHADLVQSPMKSTDHEYTSLRRQILEEEYIGTETRVYNIITFPAMIITWVAGLIMLISNPAYLVSGTPGWLHVKILLLILLVAYQMYTRYRLMADMHVGKSPMSAWGLRLWNEVPTFFLVSISFVAVLGKVGSLNYLYLGIGVAIFCILVYRGAIAYRNKRLES